MLRSAGVPTTIFTPRTGAIRTTNSATYFGLPVIGFAAIGFANGMLDFGSGKVLSNYGGTFAHKYTTKVLLP